MIDRTQLTDALEMHDAHVSRTGYLSPEGVALLAEAARILLDFPTDEMVEATAKKSGLETWRAKAVLIAVRRVMLGETE